MPRKNQKTSSGRNQATTGIAKTTVRSFFASPENSEERARSQKWLNKMAPEKLTIGSRDASPDPDDAIVTKRDLKEDRQILIQEISSLVKDLMQPLQTSLTDLVKEVKDAAKMAETASELALKMQSEVRALQSTEQLTLNRIAALERKWRQRNLKFRGLEEGVEQNKDLPSFIASWLASVLELEEGIAPIILKAYRRQIYKCTETACNSMLQMESQEKPYCQLLDFGYHQKKNPNFWRLALEDRLTRNTWLLPVMPYGTGLFSSVRRNTDFQEKLERYDL
ncbi:UNVERIFIED_CONTAM: hypothetical protein K2H54_069111 [Gekko kuhli]